MQPSPMVVLTTNLPTLNQLNLKMVQQNHTIPKGVKAMSPQTAYMMNSMLKQVLTGGTATEAYVPGNQCR